MSLSREAILKASDHRVQKVSVPEWGGDVYVRVISGRDREKIVALHRMLKEGETPDFHARVAVLFLSDEKGTRIFTEESDVEFLAEKSADILDRILDAGMKLNGFAENAVDDALGKSGANPTGGSGSS